MPQEPDDARWARLDQVLSDIDRRHELLRRDVAEHTSQLTMLHREADDLRAALGINEVVVDTAPEPHLKLVSQLPR